MLSALLLLTYVTVPRAFLLWGPKVTVPRGLPGEDQDDEPELGEQKVKMMLTQVVGERKACGQCLGASRLPSALQAVEASLP